MAVCLNANFTEISFTYNREYFRIVTRLCKHHCGHFYLNQSGQAGLSQDSFPESAQDLKGGSGRASALRRW